MQKRTHVIRAQWILGTHPGHQKSDLGMCVWQLPSPHTKPLADAASIPTELQGSVSRVMRQELWRVQFSSFGLIVVTVPSLADSVAAQRVCRGSLQRVCHCPRTRAAGWSLQTQACGLLSSDGSPVTHASPLGGERFPCCL